MKSILDRIFVDGLGGMAHGLFATLIIGTIIQQIGLFAGGDFGNMLYMAGKMAAAMTGAGIGVGVARKFNADQLVVVSAATVGMIGSVCGQTACRRSTDGRNVFLAGPGEPLGAFVAAYVAIEIGILISGKTKLDILITPFVCIGARTGDRTGCGTADLTVYGMARIADQLGNGTAAVFDGDRCIRIDGDDLDASDQLGGYWSDPESVGACGGRGDDRLLLQHGGVCRGKFPGKWVWRISGAGDRHVDAPSPEYRKTPEDLAGLILSSAILGPVGTMLLHMTNNATGSGMGTAGLVGQIMTWQVMTQTEAPVVCF